MKNLHIKIGDKAFPKLLVNIHDCPTAFNYRGKIEALNRPCISVIGTRKPSEYGKNCCRKIIGEIASITDVCIVSGLARGIDTVAHEAALKNGLYTIAVLGSGLNNIYPPENTELSNKISEHGGIISEYKENEPALDYHFPQRNRIISGLSHATIVIEAPEKSGTLITARLALDQNRLCLGVPGDIDRENSNGILKLLQHSEAYPISSGRDVVEYLRESSVLFKAGEIENNLTQKPLIDLGNGLENLLYAKLNQSRGVNISELAKTLSVNMSDLLSCLSKLEIKGLIKSRGGLYYKVI